jgi:glucose/arabinose dehydrogenase
MHWILKFLLFSPLAIFGDKFNVPEGLEVKLFSDQVVAPRQMAEGSSGYIFVGSRKSGLVSAIIDLDFNGKADSTRVVANNLNQPAGVSLFDGDLYIAEIDKIWRIKGIEAWLKENPSGIPPKELVSDDLPSDEWHGWKWLKHDSAGNLYTNIGAPCNVCLENDQRYASILKFDGQQWSVIARGVRNSVGFDFHPQTGELYFGDNGRDWLGDNLPSCELNRLRKEGSHFGFPFLHDSKTIDPEFGNISHGFDIQLPILELGAHVAPTGLAFYNSEAMGEYKNNIFITLHGSWNSSTKVGYKVVRIVLDQYGNVDFAEDFMTGFLSDGVVLGRPSAPMVMKNGSILISDDASNKIYIIRKSKV